MNVPLVVLLLTTVTLRGVEKRVHSAVRCLKSLGSQPISFQNSRFLSRPCLHHEGNGCTVRLLDRFYRKLLASKAKTRIALWSDSMMTSGLVAAQIMEVLKDSFGDGGPGFVQPGRASRWDGHPQLRGLVIRGRWLRATTVFYDGRDMRFGFGGTRFLLTRAPGRITYHFRRPVSSIVLHYRTRRYGGSVVIGAAGARHRLHLLGRDDSDAFSVFGFSPTTTVSLSFPTPGTTLYGTFFENRATAGVVVDFVGLIGARLSHLARTARQIRSGVLRFRHYDLLIYAFGRNETRVGMGPGAMMRAVELIRRDVEASGGECLVIGPSAVLRKGTDGRARTDPRVRRIARHMRDVAARAGCAYLDLLGLMGSGRAWLRHRPSFLGPDLVHPTMVGGKVLGYLIALELLGPVLGACPPAGS